MLRNARLKLDRIDTRLCRARNQLAGHTEIAFVIVSNLGDHEDAFVEIDVDDFHSWRSSRCKWSTCVAIAIRKP